MVERGISYRQSWLRQVMDGKVSPVHQETKTLLSRDSLLDATLILYNECEQQRTTGHVSEFVDKYRDTVKEIREVRIVSSDFEVLDLVGRGQFGKVELVRAKHGQYNTVYALKTVPKKVAADPSMAMSVWEERDILTHANSPWLTQAHFAFQDESNLYLVMDYLPGGDLFSLMRRQEDLFNESNVRFYFVEILLGVNAVHHMGYVHRDIKPENILLDQHGHLKLVDFGSSVRIGSSANGHCVGTASYMSPECLQAADPDYEYVFGPEVDFWALGIILYEMLFYRNPFVVDEEAVSSIDIIRNIMDWENSLVFDCDIFQISDVCRSLISSLITDIDHRFGYKEVIEHQFLSSIGVGWSQIEEMTPPFIPQVNGDADTSNFEPPAPAPTFTSERHGRSSFAGGDVLSQVAFLGYTYSSVQSSQGRKMRVRTSLAMEGMPVSTLERKWADRAEDLRVRCQELEQHVMELETLRRSKPALVDAETWMEAPGWVNENKKDNGTEKCQKAEISDENSFADKVEKKLAESAKISSISSDGYLATNQLRQENTKLKRLIVGLNVEIEEQRNRLRLYKLSAARHSESETKARERVRDLELRLRTLARRRSMQSRKIDESLADEHRQMLTTIREQADSIASLEAHNQTIEDELQEAKRLSETLREELKHASILEGNHPQNEFNSTSSKNSASHDSNEVSHDEESQYSTPKHRRSNRMETQIPMTPKEAANSSHLPLTSTPMMNAAALSHSFLERDRAVIELTNRVSELLMELNASRADLKEAEHRCGLKEEEMKAEIESYETKLKTVRNENDTLQRKYERMCIEKIEKYDENRTLKKTISRLESESVNLKVELDDLRTTESESRNSAGEITQRIFSLESEVRELTISKKAVENEKNDLNRELDTLSRRFEEQRENWRVQEQKLNESLTNAQQQRDIAVADARAKKIALSEANALLIGSKQRERSTNDECETLTRQLEEMRKRLRNAEQIVVEHSETTASVQQTEEALRKTENQLRLEMHALRTTEANLQDVNAKLENARLRTDVLQERVKELEGVEEKYQALSTEISQVRQLLRNKEDKCDRFELKLQQLTSQLETERSMSVDRQAQDAAESMNKMNDLRSRMRTNLNDSRHRCGELESKVAKLNIEVSQLSRDKQSQEAKAEALMKRSSAAEEEALRLKEECAQHITAMQHLRRDNISLQRELDEAEDSYDAMSNAKANLEAQLQAQGEEFSVERLRYTSTIQQQSKLIDMLQENAENTSGKRKGIKHLFSNSRTGFSGSSVSSAALQALQMNTPQKVSPTKSSTLKGRDIRI